MFGISSLSKFENNRASQENKEARLEKLLVGELDGKKYNELSNHDEQVSFQEAIRLAEACQIANPEEPEKEFTKELYEKVKNEYADKYLLKFFVSAGPSHLEALHGIDCFFKLYDRETNNELSMASIDLTGSSESTKEDTKADVLLSLDEKTIKNYFPDGSINNKNQTALELIDDYSNIICVALNNNMESKINNQAA